MERIWPQRLLGDRRYDAVMRSWLAWPFMLVCFVIQIRVISWLAILVAGASDGVR